MTEHDVAVLLKGPLVLIGAGKMGSALATGWLENGLDPAMLVIQDPKPSPDIVDILSKYDVKTSRTVNLEQPADSIVLAVKPQMVKSILPTLRPLAAPETLIITIIAGCKIALFQEVFGDTSAVVRAMPNTPAAIGKGITALCAGPNVNEQQKTLAETLLATVGQTIWLDQEVDMDAVTAVSGSGPAYVFLLTEALAEAGVAAGLEAKLAMHLAKATTTGAGSLLDNSEMPPQMLRENVTSPAGTTEAALNVLMQDPDGLKSLIKKAVLAAQARSKELSE